MSVWVRSMILAIMAPTRGTFSQCLPRATFRAVRSSRGGRWLPHLRWREGRAVGRAIFAGGLPSSFHGPLPGSHRHILSHSHLLLLLCVAMPSPVHRQAFSCGPPCLLLCVEMPSLVHHHLHTASHPHCLGLHLSRIDSSSPPHGVCFAFSAALPSPVHRLILCSASSYLHFTRQRILFLDIL